MSNSTKYIIVLHVFSENVSLLKNCTEGQNYFENNCFSLTYNCTDEHTAALSDLVTKLEEIVANFKYQLPQVGGLLFEATTMQKSKTITTQKTKYQCNISATKTGQKKHNPTCTATELDKGHSISVKYGL